MSPRFRTRWSNTAEPGGMSFRLTRLSLYAFAAALVLVLVAASVASAVTRSVNSQSFLGCNDFFGNPYCTIHAAIADSTSGDTILVGAGTYLGHHTIPAGLNVTITGSGEGTTIVRALPNDRVFSVEAGASLLMSGLTVDGGQVSDSGGGFEVRSAQLSLTGVTLSNNQAVIDGGAIHAVDSILDLNDVTADRNSADRGGAIFAEGTSAQTNILGGAFQFNTAVMGGAIFNRAFSSASQQTLFNGNSARFGGALFQDAGAIGQISDATLRFNSAADYGGAIFVAEQGNLSLANSFFNRNSAEEAGDDTNDGGAIANFGTVSLDTVVTSSNTADNGGTIYSEGSLTLVSSTIAGGVALENGGGVFSTGNVTATNTVFRLNEAGLEGGGVYNDRGDMSMIGGHFYSNIALNEGAGLRTHFGDFAATGVAWFENETTAGSGGGLHSYFTDLDLSANEFYDNDASQDGGGISTFYGRVNIRDTRVHDNRSGFSGGGLYLFAQGLIERTEIFGNQTGYTGGGLYTMQTVDLVEVHVHSNHSGDHGGGLYNLGRTSVVNSRIAYNTSVRDGAGVVNRRTSCNQCEGILTIVGSTIDHNVAGEAAGGLEILSGSVRLENSTLSYNQGTFGAIMAVGLNSATVDLDLDHVTIAGNRGGSLTYFPFLGALTIRHSLFAHNYTRSGFACLIEERLLTLLGPSADAEGSCGPLFLSDPSPQLGPLVAGSGLAPYHMLQPESPFVDAGDSTECLPDDQPENLRAGMDGNGDQADGNACDLGAVERQDAIAVPEPTGGIRIALLLILISGMRAGRRTR